MSDDMAVAQRSSHVWIGRFAGCLLQLRPDMRVAYAVRCAVANYHHAADLDPCDAAESFAQSVAAVASATNPAHARLRPDTPPASLRYRVVFGGRRG